MCSTDGTAALVRMDWGDDVFIDQMLHHAEEVSVVAINLDKVIKSV